MTELYGQTDDRHHFVKYRQRADRLYSGTSGCALPSADGDVWRYGMDI